ncbi:MAG: hypothetical protein ACTH4N_08785, partial [Corynebacterium casei]
MVVQANDNNCSDHPIFDFITPEYRLTGHGRRVKLSPTGWNGEEVAAAIETALKGVPFGLPVVGCIPFDTQKAAELYVPEEVTWRVSNGLCVRGFPYMKEINHNGFCGETRSGRF